MNDYNIELKIYIGKLFRELLFNNNIDFEISEVSDMWHFEITCNNEQHNIMNDFIGEYNNIIDIANISDKDLQLILDEYNFDDIYNVVSNNDFYIYDISDMDAFGSEIFEIYECQELSDNISRYFDFKEYGKDFLDCQEYVELENGRVIIFYF